MIVDTKTMKKIEETSNYTTNELITMVGKEIFNTISSILNKNHKILIICGKGNNGADGLALASNLLLNHYQVKIFLCEDIVSKDAQTFYNKLPKDLFITTIKDQYDIVIDCIYGFGFKAEIHIEQRPLFKQINQLHAYKISIDINSGCEADTGIFDNNAFVSDLTLALGCYKPFHLFNKEHHMFKELKLVELPLNYDIKSNIYEMNEDIFLANYPKIAENAYKGINGKALLIGGSFGMAGAASLNIIGALATGSTYLHAAIEDTIYPILATKYDNVVFHPFDRNSFKGAIENIMYNVDAISYGSGVNNLPYNNDILELLLQYSSRTVVLDAQAIRLLTDKLFVLKLAKPHIIMTPHIKEFADLINLPVEVVKRSRIKIAKEFAKDYGVTLVLKDTTTIVVNASGELFINNKGNQALARAGSGDLLCGMITNLAALLKDNFLASCMAVWFFNHICEMITKDTSITCFSLNNYLKYADIFFKDKNM